MWATLIALVDDGHPVIGLVAAPALGRRWWAALGSGAWAGRSLTSARQIHVSKVSRVEDASISCSSWTSWGAVGRQDEVLDLARSCWRERAYGDFWSYMLLAEGAVDIAAEPELGLHDMAALVPIVTEAGGRFTSLAGVDGPLGGNAVATNGILHDEVLAGSACDGGLRTARPGRPRWPHPPAGAAAPCARGHRRTGQRAVGADDPVAGQHDGQRVGAVGGADGPRRPRRQVEPGGDGAVGGRRAPRHRSRAPARPGAGTRCRPGAAAGRTPGGCRRSTRRAGGAPRRGRADPPRSCCGDPSAGASKWMATSAPPPRRARAGRWASPSRPIASLRAQRATVLTGPPTRPSRAGTTVAASPTSTTLHSPVATRR